MLNLKNQIKSNMLLSTVSIESINFIETAILKIFNDVIEEMYTKVHQTEEEAINEHYRLIDAIKTLKYTYVSTYLKIKNIKFKNIEYEFLFEPLMESAYKKVMTFEEAIERTSNYEHDLSIKIDNKYELLISPLGLDDRENKEIIEIVKHNR